MTCDRCVLADWIGNARQRRRARRHAKRCARCSEALERFDRIIAELSQVTPLTIDERAGWLRAAVETPSTVSKNRARAGKAFTVAALAAAVMLLVTIFPDRPAHPPAEQRVETSHADQPAATGLSPGVERPTAIAQRLQELDRMRARLDGIEQEIRELEQRASLLDARATADELWSEYGPSAAVPNL